jgi:hypothetical protein
MARTKKNARTSDTDEDDCLPFSRSVKKKKKKPTTTIQPRGPSKISSSPKDSVGSTKVSQGPPARGPRKPQKSSKDKSDSEDDLPPIQRVRPQRRSALDPRPNLPK